MNRCEIIGRLTKDIDLRYTTKEQTAITRFTLAVDRRKKDAGADFIPCIAFGKTAELIELYVKKGHKIAVTGRIQTGSFEKNGQKVYTTDVIIEDVEFLEPKPKTEPQTDTQMSIPEGFTMIDEDLPWA